MTEDVEVRIAPLGKHVPSRKKKTQHVSRRRTLPTRCSYSGVPVFFVCVYVSTVRKLQAPKIIPRIEVAHFDRLASKIAATWRV